MSEKHWSMKTALKQVAECDFICEGGALRDNAAWRWLVDAAKAGPEFLPGQGVFCEVKVEAAGAVLTKWVHYYVVGCRMESGTDDRYWVYSLSNDPPGPYHYGTVQHASVKASALRLDVPVPEST